MPNQLIDNATELAGRFAMNCTYLQSVLRIVNKPIGRQRTFRDTDRRMDDDRRGSNPHLWRCWVSLSRAISGCSRSSVGDFVFLVHECVSFRYFLYSFYQNRFTLRWKISNADSMEMVRSSVKMWNMVFYCDFCQRMLRSKCVLCDLRRKLSLCSLCRFTSIGITTAIDDCHFLPTHTHPTSAFRLHYQELMGAGSILSLTDVCIPSPTFWHWREGHPWTNASHSRSRLSLSVSSRGLCLLWSLSVSVFSCGHRLAIVVS